MFTKKSTQNRERITRVAVTRVRYRNSAKTREPAISIKIKGKKSTALYQTPFSKAYWRDAAMELKDIRILVFAALMIALRVALKSLGIPIAADLKINIAFFINAVDLVCFIGGPPKF